MRIFCLVMIAAGVVGAQSCVLPTSEDADSAVDNEASDGGISARMEVPDSGLSAAVGCRYLLPGVVVQVVSFCDAMTGEGTIVAQRRDALSLPAGWSSILPWVEIAPEDGGPWAERIVSIAYSVSEQPPAALGVKAVDGEVAVHPAFAHDERLTMTALEAGVFTVAQIEASPADGCTSRRAGGSYAVADTADLGELEGVSSIEGSLTIAVDDDDGLSRLSCLRSIGGSLTIRNTSGLRDVGGLANLARVDRNLAVIGNSGLTELTLPQLQVVGGSLSFERNPGLSTVGLGSLMVSGAVLVSSTAVPVLSFDRLVQARGPVRVTLNGRLETFAAPALEAVRGDIDIVRNGALARVELDELHNLEGSLILNTNGGNAMTTIFRFPSLARILNKFSVRQNPQLMNLDGFGALTEVGAAGVDISANASLVSVEGLGGLQTVHGDLRVAINAALPALVAPGLRTVHGDVEIVDHAALAEIDLSGLSDVRGRLRLEANGGEVPSMTYDLGMLSSVGEDLRFLRNPARTAFDGFGSLVEVGGAMIISSNAGLTSIEGLDALTRVGEDFTVASNGVLTSVVIDSLLSVGGDIVVRDNDAIALVALDGLSQINGALTLDGNGGSSTATTAYSFVSSTRVARGVTIQRNPSLQNLGGFDGVSEIGVGLKIQDNAALSGLGFDRLFLLGSGLEISSNARLPTCTALDFRDRMVRNGWTGSATVADNLPDMCSP